MLSANYSRNNPSAQSVPTPKTKPTLDRSESANPYAAPESNNLPTSHHVTTTQNPLTQPEKHAESFKLIAAAATIFALPFTYQSLVALANKSFAPAAALAILASGSIIICSRGKINQLKSKVAAVDRTTQQATQTPKIPSD
jgi:hypothetical protein